MSETLDRQKARWNRGARDDWETPPALFAELDREFGFTLDAAASYGNAKCARYITRDDDGLAQSWEGEVVWCNPPYGHGVLSRWVEKGLRESAHATVVMLVPAYTASGWWHDYATRATEIRFLRGKVRFVGAEDRAMFASAVLVFRRHGTAEGGDHGVA